MKIAYIDDKDFSLQIKKSIPSDLDYEFYYFSSYKQAIWQKFDVLILDYYLDLDLVKSVDIISKLDYKICIWFSSVLEKSREIAEKTGSKYFCEKEFWDNINDDLFSIFLLISLETNLFD